MLKELAEKYKDKTDKNTSHSYIDHLYDELLSPIQNSVTNLLEIGISGGGSILLWREFFHNATIHGVDIKESWLSTHNDSNVKVHCNDAYSLEFIESLPNYYYDIIIDDGPHTLDSMITFVSKYLSKTKSGGYLILEDIQNISWVDTIKSHIDQSIAHKTVLYDLRPIKNRYDDIVLVIQNNTIDKI